MHSFLSWLDFRTQNSQSSSKTALLSNMFLRQMDYVPTKNNITSIVYCNASCLCHNRVTGEKKWPFWQKKQTCQQTSKQQYISFLMTILWLSDLTFLTLPIKPTAFTRNSQRRRRAQRSMKTLTIGITIALDIFYTKLHSNNKLYFVWTRRRMTFCPLRFHGTRY